MSNSIEEEFQRMLGAYRLVVHAGAPLPEGQVETMRGLLFSGVKFVLDSLADSLAGEMKEGHEIADMERFFNTIRALQKELDSYQATLVEEAIQILLRHRARRSPDKK